MARILITGSADGRGLMAGQHLARDGHEEVLHARSDARGAAGRRALPEASGVVVGDVATIGRMRAVAAQANATGRFDAVIHNAGIGYRETHRISTADGLSHVFATNVLAPYLLTARVERPDRLVYLKSGMHPGGATGHGRPSMGAAALERGAGLRREQVLRRRPRLRGRTSVA